MLDSILLPLLISALASILVGLAIEKARIPVLVIFDAHAERVEFNDLEKPIGTATSYRLRVRNRELGKLLSWFIHRQPARDCRASLRFVSKDGNPLTMPEMPGRWASSEQPVPLRGYVGQAQEPVVLIDHARYAAGSRMDIPAGSSEVLDVAVHFDSDASAFGWTNSSYQFPGGKNPLLQLPPGTYVVEAAVHAEGYTVRSMHEIVIRPNSVGGAAGLAAATPSQVIRPMVSQSVATLGT